MSISDVLSDSLHHIMEYLYDDTGQRQDCMFREAWVPEKLLPVVTAMNALLRELDTPPNTPQSHPLHCVYCDMDFPDVLQLLHHERFSQHVVGDVMRGRSDEDEGERSEDEDDDGPVF